MLLSSAKDLRFSIIGGDAILLVCVSRNSFQLRPPNSPSLVRVHSQYPDMDQTDYTHFHDDREWDDIESIIFNDAVSEDGFPYDSDFVDAITIYGDEEDFRDLHTSNVLAERVATRGY